MSFKPTQIIIHHSFTKDNKTVSWDAIRRFHKTDPNYKFHEIGYHFGIELINDEYEVLAGRALHEMGAHCKGQNGNSIGICVVGDFDNNNLPEAQYEKLKKLVFGLMKTLNIPTTEVKRHSDYSVKTCPGLRFPYSRLITDLQRMERTNS